MSNSDGEVFSGLVEVSLVEVYVYHCGLDAFVAENFHDVKDILCFMTFLFEINEGSSNGFEFGSTGFDIKSARLKSNL